MSIVVGVVIELEARGLTHVLAHRRWKDPAPGESVVVITSDSTWTAGLNTAEFPLVKALVYSSPTAGQADAEQIGEPTAAAVRRALHCPDGRLRYWGTERVIGALMVGTTLAEVEGHEEWRVRTLTFEVEVG